jgi:prepilin-type N-terminal cleavage/methylation domain-containing protein
MRVFRNNANPLVVSLSNHSSARFLRQAQDERFTTFLNARPGFTLIEVLLAMAIIGLILTPIFAIQLGVMRSNARASETLQRIFFGKQFLVDNEFQLKPEEQEKRIEKKLEKPPTTLIYELKKIPENSALKKFKDVLIESVIMQWIDRQGKKRQERLVTFVYKPEVKG